MSHTPGDSTQLQSTSSSIVLVVGVQSLNSGCSATADRYLGDLEIEGIIERPRSPTPPVPLEERDPDELTPEELREQVRLLRARDSMVNVKQEYKREKRARERSVTLGAGAREDDEEDDVTVTGQWDRRKRARGNADGEDVVDLTDE